MKTLAAAWNWYEVTRRNLVRMQRLGRKYWPDSFRESAAIWQDDEFRTLESSDIVNETATSLEPIDDLAIVVLFSAFESHVRDFLVKQISPETAGLSHPILKEAAADALQGVEQGSFYRRVLFPLKKQESVSADLVTQIDQIRDYRNWVAHGRRKRNTDITSVTPQMTYERLNQFLAALGIPTEPEHLESESPGEIAE